MALTSITKDFIVNSGLVVQGSAIATTATSINIGTLSVLGGAAVQKNIIIGSTATVYGDTNLLGQLAVIGASTLSSTLFVSGNITANSQLAVAGLSTLTGALWVGGNATMNAQLSVLGLSTLTGALWVGGAANLNSTLSVSNTATLKSDLSVAGLSTLTGALWVGGAANLNSTLAVQGASTLSSTLAVIGASTLSNNLWVGGTVTHNTNTVMVGVAQITNSTAATTSGVGALTVSGGAYIGDNLVVHSTASNTGTLASNALYVNGGVGIQGGLAVSGDVVFKANAYFVGPTTYAFSTNTVYSDNLIELHAPAGGVTGAWTLDDGKDIGFRFHYYNSADKNAAIVLANDTKYFEFYADGSEANGIFSSVNYATLKAGALELVGNTNATSTNTGDLRVLGGVGIAQDLYVGGNIYGIISTASNVANGHKGELVIQSAPGRTTFVAAGTGINQVLVWDNVNSTATWALSPPVQYAYYAGTATNLAGGVAGDIPVQTTGLGWAGSATTFDTGLFQYDVTDKFLKVDNVKIYGKGVDNGPGSAQNQVVASTGTNIEVYSDTSSQLNAGNSNFVTANSSTVTLSVGSGAYTLVLANSGNVTLGGSTGGSTFIAPKVKPTNLTANRVTYYDGTSLVDSTNLKFDGTTITANAATVTNTLTAGGIVDSALTTNGGLVYTDGSGTLSQSNTLFFTNSTVTTPTVKIATGSKLRVTDLTQNGIAFITDSTGTVAVDATNFSYSAAGTQLSVANFTGGTVTATTALYVTNANPTFTTSTGGAVSITGGVGIAKDLYVGTTATVNSLVIGSSKPTFTTSTGGALSVPGGVGIAKDLFVQSTATFNSVVTINSDLYVDGTIFVQGASLTGVDKITGSTGTFVDIVSTGTSYLGKVTATNTLFVGSTATFGGDVYVDGTLFVQGTSLTGIDKITGSTGTFQDVVSQGTIYANNINATGTTTATTLNVTTKLSVTGDSYLANTTATGKVLVTNTATSTVMKGNTTNSSNWSFKTLGGIAAVGNIVSGGVVVGGDAATPGNDTGSVNAFYAVNNMQAARTISALSGTTKTTIDSWQNTVYTSAKYIVQIKDGSNIHVEEIMLIQDGTYVYISEYGIISNNGQLGVFDAAISGSNVNLTFTPTSASSMTIQVVRQSILTAEESFC